VGDFSIAIGAPLGLSQTLTFGIISAKGRRTLNITDYGDFIQTDAAINQGNSGGPLINIHGDVIGMNTAIFSQSGGNIGIGFAIPSNIIRDVAQRLINKGSIRRAKLGVYIQDLDDKLAKEFDLDNKKGSLVTKVEPGSTAEKAGIKEGDVIKKVDNTVVEDSSHLKLIVGMTQVNKKVTIELVRKGRIKRFKVKLEASKEEKPGAIASTEKKSNMWGMALQKNSIALKNKYNLLTTKGLIVTDVKPGSIAAKAGIIVGDVILGVNKKKVNSIKDFKRYDNKKTILLRFLRRDMYLYLQMSK